jgi:hypothetical protein
VTFQTVVQCPNQPSHSIPQTSNITDLNQWFMSRHIRLNKQTNLVTFHNKFMTKASQQTCFRPSTSNHGMKPTTDGTSAYRHKHHDLLSLSLHSPEHGHPVPRSSQTQTATLLPAGLQSSCLHVPVQLHTGSC